MKIRVADYMADFLAAHNMGTIFTIVGGGAMHLNDAFGKHPAIRCYYNHNEQACGMAAEGYTRISGRTGVVCVTTGPGGTNAISGVLGAWLDSIPMLVVSGQVKYETTVRGTGLNLRQMGDQEFDISRCVSALTKYACMVRDPRKIRWHMEKALYLAEHGRPGPCWLDIPMDVQSAVIEMDGLEGFEPQELNVIETCLETGIDSEAAADFEKYNYTDLIESPDTAFISYSGKQNIYGIENVDNIAKDVVGKICQAKRPVIYIGNGVHIARAECAITEMADKLQIPVVAGFNAHDIFDFYHPLYIGRPGTIGDRAGNFAVQNSDLLLVIGCRLNIRQIGYNWDSFAREAYKIMIDIDRAEMEKPSIKIDMKVQADVKRFAEAMNANIAKMTPESDRTCSPVSVAKMPEAGCATAEMAEIGRISIGKAKASDLSDAHADWLAWCRKRKEKYPTVLPEYWERKELINPYCFMEMLGEHMGEGDVVVAANATACICSFQALKVKKNQRIYSNSGSASMGYDLPAAIGSAVAMRLNKGKGYVIEAGVSAGAGAKAGHGVGADADAGAGDGFGVKAGDSVGVSDMAVDKSDVGAGAKAGYGIGADADAGAGDGSAQTGNIICLAGDGSIQMNIQELQTIMHYKLPIKIFVLNNNGYHSIRQTQNNFFGGKLVGCEPESGVSFPDMQRLAVAYGIPFNRMGRHSDMEGKIKEALHAESCFISEVMLSADQPFAPKPSSVRLEDGRMVSQPLENLAPFLSREEFLENMIIKPLEDRS